MKVHQYNEMMRWLTRPAPDPSIKQIATSNPLNIPAHMQHQMEGGQLTPEEFYQNQSIPIEDRPFTGKVGGLVEPGVTHYATEDTWSIYKITRPGHPHQGKWAHRRPNKSIDYYDTKAQAQRIAERAKVIQYEAMERPTTGVFQKKVKKLLDEGLTKKQTAKNLGVNFKVVDRAIEEGNIKWKFEPYINVPKNLNYVKKNYGSLSRETMAKKLFPNEPLSTSLSRIGKLSQKLFDTGELKPTQMPTKEHAKKMGFYKDPEHEIVARIKKAKRDAIKARSVESIETAYAGTKKVHLSHLDDIYSQFTTGETLGYAPGKINQEFLKEYDNKMKSLYKKRARLLKEKPKDLVKQLEQINITGARLAGETGGYKSFKFLDPYTLKPYQFSVDAAKTIDPLGILEGKTIQEASIPADPTVKRSKKILDLSPVDRYFFEKNRKAVLASQKKVNIKTLTNDLQQGTVNFAKKIEGTEIARKICSAKANGGVAGCLNLAKKNPAKFMSRAIALGLAGELAFELAAAAPSYAEGKTGSEILGESIFGIFGAGTTFNEELAKYADPKAKEIIALQEDIAQLEKTGSTIGALDVGLEGETELQKRKIPGFLKESESALGRLPIFEDKARLASYSDAMDKYLAAQQERAQSLPRQATGKALHWLATPFREGIKDVGLSPGLFNTGGRVGLKEGKMPKIPMTRRGFLQWLLAAAGTGIAAGTGLLKWGKVAGKGKTVIKAGDHIIQGTNGMPDWFIPLINRITNEGTDNTATLATKSREIVHTKKIEGHDVDVYQDLTTGDIRVVVEGQTGKNLTAYDEGLQLEYTAPVEDVTSKGKPFKTKSDFQVEETEASYYRTSPDDADLEVGPNIQGQPTKYDVKKGTFVVDETKATTDGILSDTNFLKNYAKKKKPNMGQIVETSKKKKEIKYLNKNPHEDPRIPEGPEPDYDDYLPGIDDLD